MPIFLIMAGLHKNIQNLEDEENLTFLYRTPKYEMGPLNISMIQQRYKNIFLIDSDEAFKMAAITKGYAFAYQVLGKYIWESNDRKVTEEVLIQFDEALEKYVFDKIWSASSKTDKWYLQFIAQKSTMETSELLELTKKKQNEFAQYRARLKDKGIIDVSSYGIVKINLPRFDVFVKNRVSLEML